MKKTVHILYLYPYEMNTYGDWGNVATLVRRIEARGHTTTVYEHRPGQKLPTEVDLIFMGGGQDSGQSLILSDLQRHATHLHDLVESDCPTLTICGGYQLFGHSFLMQSGELLEGLGVFNVVTQASPERLIGNIRLQSPIFGELYGFENHSGLTQLGENAEPLGEVVMGAGNNGLDRTEGVIYRRAIGTYLHGPLLPKNPEVADWLIAQALGVESGDLQPLEDTFIDRARAVIRHLKR